MHNIVSKTRLEPLLSKALTPKQIDRLFALGRVARRHVYNAVFSNDLAKLSVGFESDKWGFHSYTPHYERHLRHLKNRRINLLEIGIGGYDAPTAGGGSLRMWQRYFPRATIHGIDIFDKSPHDDKRIRTHCGSQVDAEFLQKVVDGMPGGVDVVIDDGSHYNQHIVETFKLLFPRLNADGIYVVEDLQTSYWDHAFGDDWGGSRDLTAPHTAMNFFKALTDALNHEEFLDPDYRPSYFDRHIVGMHFYHNMVFVQKGLNDEGSNLVPRKRA